MIDINVVQKEKTGAVANNGSDPLRIRTVANNDSQLLQEQHCNNNW